MNINTPQSRATSKLYCRNKGFLFDKNSKEAEALTKLTPLSQSSCLCQPEKHSRPLRRAVNAGEQRNRGVALSPMNSKREHCPIAVLSHQSCSPLGGFLSGLRCSLASQWFLENVLRGLAISRTLGMRRVSMSKPHVEETR